MHLMEFETEWEQRNYERQKKLELNRYTFISHQDEKALRRKRNVLLYAIVGTLVAGVICMVAIVIVIYKLTEGDKYTTGEILEKIYAGVTRLLKQLLKPETWKIIWHDMRHGDTLIRLKIYAVIGQLIFVVSSVWYGIKQTKKNYEKEVVIDLNTNEIAYKDNKTNAKFNSSDIERWECFDSVQKKRKGDIFFLKDRRMFYLDGFYQNDLHEFLIAHTDELKLPKPKKVLATDVQQY